MKKNKILSKSLAVYNKDDKFKLIEIERRNLKENDILIEIKYAGICHSDIHKVKSEWNEETYPIVPGHEISGIVIDIGKKVTRFNIGDNVGVGCLVNSCRKCDNCLNNYEQCCDKAIYTYGSIDYYNNNEITYGGYSKYIVVDQDFAIKIPKNAPLDLIAPLLCAGITTYSPIAFSNVKKNDNVAIMGFGGLGSMALKYAKLKGANVYIIARNNRKEELALKLGAQKLFSSLDQIDVQFDLIISTIPTKYDVFSYVKYLKFGGELAILGIPPINENWSLNPSQFVFNQHKKVYGSLIGGIKLTQEMLDLSIKHNIYPEIELISASKINEVYEKMTSGKAQFRYVIDISTIDDYNAK